MKLGEIMSSIKGLETDKLFSPVLNAADEQEGESFGSILTKSIGEVNKTQVTAYNAMEQIATGKVENLQKAVQQIEEAELSLKLALEVKNKALNAYKEVMRMQV
ncbi:MAG: flagellar hook-basal body complex protein FliE [Arcobacteraceae bacterium]|jgi:flagellar hook-basal body complex protein FliE|nr:flagellar hook-basal body complex protein FliE [Arcobacteraceae bacterium]